jgi:hypothetical protein
MSSNYYVSSVAYAAVTQWAATTAYTLGQYRRQLAAQTFGNERVFKCTTAGTSGGSEPTWNRNDGATTTDGTVVWTQVAGREAEQAAGNWKAPLANLKCLTNLFTMVSGDNAFVSNDHVDTTTGNTFQQTSGIRCFFLSVSRTGSTIPPTSTDLLAGAQFGSSGANDTVFRPNGYVYGFTIFTGSGAGSNVINLGAAGVSTLDTCQFVLNNTGSSARISLVTGLSGRIRLVNPKFKFGAIGQALHCGGGSTGDVTIQDAPTPIDTGGSMPTYLFSTDFNATGYMLCERCDFSSFTGTSLFSTGNDHFPSGCDFVDCRLPTGDKVFDQLNKLGTQWPYRLWNCDDSTGNKSTRFQEFCGTIYDLRSSSQAARVGGAQDEAGDFLGWELKSPTTTQNNQYTSWWRPAGNSIPIVAYIKAADVGASRTVEVQVAATYASDSSNLWIDVMSLDSTGSPLGAKHTTRSADPLAAGSALTTSTEDWTALASARANSHAYVVGDMYKAASNAGRLFVCVTAGTSAGSEPGAVASATDGSSFSDGTATFIAVLRYKLSLSFTPQRAGIVRVYVCRVFTSTMCSGNERTLIDPLAKIT